MYECRPNITADSGRRDLRIPMSVQAPSLRDIFWVSDGQKESRSRMCRDAGKQTPCWRHHIFQAASWGAKHSSANWWVQKQDTIPSQAQLQLTSISKSRILTAKRQWLCAEILVRQPLFFNCWLRLPLRRRSSLMEDRTQASDHHYNNSANTRKLQRSTIKHLLGYHASVIGKLPWLCLPAIQLNLLF